MSLLTTINRMRVARRLGCDRGAARRANWQRLVWNSSTREGYSCGAATAARYGLQTSWREVGCRGVTGNVHVDLAATRNYGTWRLSALREPPFIGGRT